MKSNVSINLGVWIGLTLVVFFCGAIGSLPLYQFTHHLASTQGQITQKLPQEHQSVYFIYTVNKKVYSGRGSLNVEFDKIQTGSPVTVFFNTINPAQCSVQPPALQFVKVIGDVVAACAVIPLIAMVFLHRYKVLPEWDLFKNGSLLFRRN